MVALFEGAPTVIIGFGIQGDFFLGGFGEVVEEHEVGRFVKFLGTDAVLRQGELNSGDL